MSKFNKVKETTFEELVLGAGIIVDTFTPDTATIGNILWATTGGISFKDAPEYTDFGDDIDNCPKNTKELKQITGREVTLSGTALTVTPAIVSELIGASDVDGIKITPRDNLTEEDFKERWWVGEYGENGFIAIHLKDTLNVDGLQITSTDRSKGTFPFNLTAHYSIADADVVPYEVYVKAGE